MIQIEPHRAAELLSQEPCRYLCDMLALQEEPAPVPRTVYADSENPSVLMMVEEDPLDPWAILSGYQERFERECLEWLRIQDERFTLASVDRRVFAMPALRQYFYLGSVGRLNSFVCTTLDRIPPLLPGSCEISLKDQDAITRYPQDPERGCPTLVEAFQRHIIEGRGRIFAFKEEGEILGYLACHRAYENIWDVDYVHVREGCRGRGLGTQLAAAYAREMLLEGQIPYYSNAICEASERAARKAGFSCCRELVYARISPRPR